MSATDGRVEITKARRPHSPAKAALLRLKALVDLAGDPRDLLAIATVLRELIALRAVRDELAAAGAVPRWGIRYLDGTGVVDADDEDEARGWLTAACPDCPAAELVVAHDRVIRGEWRVAP